jgi:hypothetical protein
MHPETMRVKLDGRRQARDAGSVAGIVSNRRRHLACHRHPELVTGTRVDLTFNLRFFPERFK